LDSLRWRASPYDYSAAERGYARLFNGAHDRYAVYARLGIALGFEMRSFNRDAVSEFDRARKAAHELGDRIAESEALLHLAWIRGATDGIPTMEALLDTVAPLLPDSVLDLQAALVNRRARISSMRGRTAESFAKADSSLALARRAGTLRGEADAVLLIGQLLHIGGQWDSALVVLRRSEDLYRRARAPNVMATPLFWESLVLGSLGRLGEMREVNKRQIAVGEATHNPVTVAEAHRALGATAEMLGDWTDASDHLRKALALSLAAGDSNGVLQTNKFLAKVAFVAGDLAGAKRMVTDFLRRAERAQDASDQYEAQRSLANIAAREGDWPAVTRALDAARAQLASLPGPSYRAWLFHDEARLALAHGDLSTAERALDSYLQWATGRGADVLRFDARTRLADIYARRGELARAERELLSATDDIDRWRARLGDVELRSLAFQTGVTIEASAFEPAANGARAARVLGSLADAGRVDVAFTLAERWRARDLSDRLARAAALQSGQSGQSGNSPPATGKSLSGAPAKSAADIVAAIPDDHTALVEFIAAEGAPITAFVCAAERHSRACACPPFDSLAESVARFDALLESGADAARLGRSLGVCARGSSPPAHRPERDANCRRTGWPASPTAI
jgi:tetratricopeptide (TPR) repeat protein